MTTSLSAEQVERYWKDGFINQLPILSAEQAADWLDRLETIERREIDRSGGTWKARDFRPWEEPEHPLRAWLTELVQLPAILDAVEGILGPDIMVRNADVFIKEPGIRRTIGWHWDTAERGPDADRIVTAWLALTPATQANGCMRYAAGSHLVEIPDAPQDKYHLTFSRKAIAALDPASLVFNEMDPGFMSIHHFRLAHASGDNKTERRRVAFVVRYMAPTVTQQTSESGVAMLVRGRNTATNYVLRDRFPMTWST